MSTRSLPEAIFRAAALAGSALAAASCAFPGPGEPGFFEVTVAVDADDRDAGDGVCRSTLRSGACTLRAAISESNALAGQNAIALGERTHTLSIAEPLLISDRLSIEGQGRDRSIVDGDSRGAIFSIEGADVWLRDFAIVNGGETSAGGAISVRNGGFLTVGSVVVSDSVAYTGGGGIYVQNGDLRMVDSALLDNRATGAFGGGLYISDAGRAVLDRTTFARNTSNRAGAISNFGTLRITNSTLSGNSATSTGVGTGAIVNAGVAHFNNVTIHGNSSEAPAGDSSSGGVLSTPATSDARTTMSNTVIAGNRRRGVPDDCKGRIESYGYNLVQTVDGCTLAGTTAGNLTGLDPDLFPLAYSSGAETPVHLPRSASPLIGAGHPQVGAGVAPLGRCEPRDQAGRLRQLTGSGERCDIGSIERR